MKLNLRNFALATAVAVAGSMSAQTLTQEWVHTSGVQANGSARFCTGFDGDVIIPDKAARTIIKWNADGSTTAYDLNQVYTDNNLVDASKEDTPLLTGGVAITTDDAGNILTNVNFPNASSCTDWIIIPADGSDIKYIQLTMPEGITAARVDNVGRVVGDVLSDEGGYLYIGPNGAKAAAVIKIANGEQDESMSLASVAIPDTYAFGTSVVAVPSLNSVEEIESAVDPSATFYIRSRSHSQIYGWNEDGTEMVQLAVTQNSGGAEDFDVFTLGDTQYLVQTVKSEVGGARSCSFSVFNVATGEVVANFNNETATSGQWASFCARPIDDKTAYIYQFCAGIQVALYKFSLESEEPQPAADPLYAAGAFQGWDPANAAEFTYENGVYVLDLEVGDTEREFKISTAKGDWDAFNAGVLGIAEGETWTTQYLTKDAPATLYAGGKDNIGLPWAGTWTVTVDLTANTIVATTETPNPGNPAELYVIGWVNGEQWSPSNGVVLEQVEDGIYKNNNVNINGGPATGTAYFSIASALGTWDDVNAKTRYGATSNNEAIVKDATTTITTNGDNAWTIETGNYSITVNINDMTMVVSNTVGIESIETENAAPAVYYNLQGVEVSNPVGGVFIKVQGGKASKVVK